MKNPMFCSRLQIFLGDQIMELEKGELRGANWEEDHSEFSWGNLKDSVLWVAYATHSTLKPVPTLPNASTWDPRLHYKP